MGKSAIVCRVWLICPGRKPKDSQQLHGLFRPPGILHFAGCQNRGVETSVECIMTTFPDLAVINGIPYVSSLNIADHFQKRHADVLEAIRRVSSECPPEFIERNFSLNKYSDDIGRELPMYHLTRDGFSLLAMGFTGKKALAWKVKYIEAFNAMERELLEQAQGKKRLERGSGQRAITENAGRAPKKWATMSEHAARINALSADAEQKANECIKAVSDLGFALLFRPVCLDPEVSTFGKTLEHNLPALSFAAQTSVKALCDMVGAYMSGLTAAQE